MGDRDEGGKNLDKGFAGNSRRIDVSKPATGSRTIKRLQEEASRSKFLYEEHIKRLEETICGLKRALLDTVPYEFLDIIEHASVLPEDLWSWEREAIKAIIEKTVVVPSQTPYHKDRAECPLCRSRPGQETGYAMPLGLERHLEGKGLERCSVMRAVMDLHQRRDQTFRSPLAISLEARLHEKLRNSKSA
jgi:hypothetical protein